MSLSEKFMYYSRILADHGADAEDLEQIQNILNKQDKGLFKEIPVAEGTEVYVIDYTYECKYDYECPFSGFDKGKCEDDVFCENQDRCYRVHKARFNYTLLEAVGRTVFLTEADAETARKRLEGGEQV